VLKAGGWRLESCAATWGMAAIDTGPVKHW